MSCSGISLAVRKSAPRSRQITTTAPHHSRFLQARCPSVRPTNSVKALKAQLSNFSFQVNARTRNFSGQYSHFPTSMVKCCQMFWSYNRKHSLKVILINFSLVCNFTFMQISHKVVQNFSWVTLLTNQQINSGENNIPPKSTKSDNSAENNKPNFWVIFHCKNTCVWSPLQWLLYHIMLTNHQNFKYS